MLLATGDGTPIRIKRPLQDTIEGTESIAADINTTAPKTLPIVRDGQKHDAWCYAATSAMVINFCHPTNHVEQCKVVSFVKKPVGGSLECCQSLTSTCTARGCELNDFIRLFDEFKVLFEGSGIAHDPVIGRVTLSKLEDEFQDGRPVMVIVDWNDINGSHALLVAGFDNVTSRIFIIDPLDPLKNKLDYFGGWHSLESLESGFGHGSWAHTFPGLMKNPNP